VTRQRAFDDRRRRSDACRTRARAPIARRSHAPSRLPDAQTALLPATRAARRPRLLPNRCRRWFTDRQALRRVGHWGRANTAVGVQS